MSEFDERSLLAAFVKCGVTDEDEKGSVHQYFKELRVRELVDLLAREPDGVRAHVLGCLSSPNFGAVLKAHERLTRPSPEPERPTDSQTSSETAPTPPREREAATKPGSRVMLTPGQLASARKEYAYQEVEWPSSATNARSV